MTRTHTRARVHTRAKCITTGITRTRTQQPEHKFKVTPSPRTPPTTSHLPAHLSHLHWSPTRFCNLLLLSCKKTKKKNPARLVPNLPSLIHPIPYIDPLYTRSPFHRTVSTSLSPFFPSPYPPKFFFYSAWLQHGLLKVKIERVFMLFYCVCIGKDGDCSIFKSPL